MRNQRWLLAAALTLPFAPAAAQAAPPPPPPRFAKCADLQAKFPHGVARPEAVDVVRGVAKPATKFTVHPVLYLANRHLDRDRDGVACEKR
ncbi:excalibur calcium-binding domain-containing protein [Paractinoplanes rishiriensis]|uniref:Excalibur calcium-binding domain-containing protein n=1 Tax=Paractinoplanes rishiriensis TaxID=1050105 RepID=A0A919JYT8_9ACTN|nr:excalibur calcium-binding domain-containing protein [Actinoplanes rishiriensis]GIE97410.1 hypothetical protein Ari01nite_48750 [Actinoplanes rishiriensis]